VAARLLKLLVTLLVLSEAGYMLFDGLHALITGDYVRPTSGAYAGQLGPWAGLVASVGIDPLSLGMKLVFVVYGAVWFGGLIGFVRGERWGWRAMAAGATGSSWYLLVGTIHSVLILLLLFTPPVRRAFGERPKR
jgi:hypothetical protein